jgi:rfaE bifunctional protein kinase chain/domain
VSPDLVNEARSLIQPKPRAARVGVIGDLCMDRFVFGSVDRISPEAPVPLLTVERRVDRLGCAANVCTNLASLKDAFQLEQDVFSVVGNDALGTEVRRQLRALGPGLKDHLVEDGSRSTTLKTRFLAGSHHQMLRVDDENTHSLDAAGEEAVLKALRQCLPALKVLIVQDYAKGLLSERLLPQVLKAARDAGVLTLLDPNPKTPPSRYRGADLITPNVSEAEILLGGVSLAKGRDDERMAEACLELKRRLDLRMCLITRSAHGMTFLDERDQAFHFPAIARSVFDVTGAGDTVVAVLAAALACGASPQAACILATAAASVVVAKVGTATASAAEIAAELEASGFSAKS